MSLFNIRSWADARAFAYVLLPLLTTLLVGNGVLTQDKANLWFSLATAILGPVMAAFYARTLSVFRVAFYSVLGAVQALVIGYGIAHTGFLDPWMPLVVTLIGASTGGVAAANTDTSPSRAVAALAQQARRPVIRVCPDCGSSWTAPVDHCDCDNTGTTPAATDAGTEPPLSSPFTAAATLNDESVQAVRAAQERWNGPQTR